MVQSHESAGDIKIVGDSIAEVVAEAVKQAGHGVFGIAEGYITDGGDEYSGAVQMRTEPFTAEQLQQHLNFRLNFQAGEAAEDGRLVRQSIVDPSCRPSPDRCRRGDPT